MDDDDHDRQASVPAASLHQRILGDIESKILSGIWPPGHKIPSEQVLSEHYHCSRMTVNKVLTQLARAGLVRRRRKSGSIVLPQNSESAILEIYDVRDEVEALGGAYRHAVLDRIIRSPTRHELEFLSLGPRPKVLKLICLHFCDNQPFCLEERLINLSLVPEAAVADFADLAPGPWLLAHVPWSAGEHRIAAEAVSLEAAGTLKVAPGSPVLVVLRQTWKQSETVTQVRLTYPGGRHALTAHFTPSQRLSAPGP